MTARDRGHVEEIINHLKRVENYYRINLTSEIEWLRGLNGYKEYLCTESVGTFEKGKTYKAHPNSPVAKMKNNFVTVEEEPASDDFTKALAECIHQAQGNVVDPMVLAETWKDELIKLAKSEESVSENLEEYINELSKQFPEVSFAKLSRIAVRVAKWQKEQFEKNRLKHCNSLTNEQAELEQKFVDQHLDKHNRMPTFLDAIEYGMRLQKEKMMAK